MRLAFACFLGLAPAAFGLCSGTDLRDTLSGPEQARLEALVADAPFATGTMWAATKDGRTSTILGTFHISDDGPAPMPPGVLDRLADADRVLLEVNSEDAKAFEAQLVSDPSLFLSLDGAPLEDAFEASEWQLLSDSAARYGFPPAFLSRVQPWFLVLMLSIPSCAFDPAAVENGIDRQVEEAALRAGLAVDSLEDPNIVFGLLSGLPREDVIEILRISLSTLSGIDDYFVTTRDMYRDGETLKIWEIGRILAERDYPADFVDAQLATGWEALVAIRNAQWLETLVPAMEQEDLFIAVGALHLPDEDGILAGLEAAGFTLDRLQ